MEQAKNISKNLEFFRKTQGFTLEAVAEYLGVSHAIICFYEKGTREIPYEKLVKLANLYGVSLKELNEPNPEIVQANTILAFRADEFCAEDLQKIAEFKKIVMNYLKMKRILTKNEA